MSVEAADVAAMQARAEGVTSEGLEALTSIPAVLAFMVAQAREEGIDETDAVELLARAAELSPQEMRRAERVLRRLGYAAVADRLKEVSKRPRNPPKSDVTP